MLSLRADERGLGWGSEEVILKVWSSLVLSWWRLGGGEMARWSASDGSSGRWRSWAAEATVGLMLALWIVIVILRGEERED